MLYQTFSKPIRLNDRPLTDIELERIRKEGVEESEAAVFYCDILIASGVTGYEGEKDNVLIHPDNLPLLQQFAYQFVGIPMFIEHINNNPDYVNRKIVGFVSTCVITEAKNVGFYYIVFDKEAIRLLENGWETSSSWEAIREIRTEGIYEHMENGISIKTPYHSIPLDIKADHVAIVEKGRHNRQINKRLNSADMAGDNTEEKLSLGMVEKMFNMFGKRQNSEEKEKSEKEEHHNKKHDKGHHNDDEHEEEKHHDKHHNDGGEGYATHEEVKKLIAEHIKEYHNKHHSKKDDNRNNDDDDDDNKGHHNDDEHEEEKHHDKHHNDGGEGKQHDDHDPECAERAKWKAIQKHRHSDDGKKRQNSLSDKLIENANLESQKYHEAFDKEISDLLPTAKMSVNKPIC